MIIEDLCSLLYVFVIQVTHFRQLYTKVISDKHEDVMAKFGAILAQGIIDAGTTKYLVQV